MEARESTLAERLQSRKNASNAPQMQGACRWVGAGSCLCASDSRRSGGCRISARKRPAQVKRKSKHAPMEVSSKISISRLREVVPVKRKRARDPRFDPLSGQFNEAAFERAYEFLDGYEVRLRDRGRGFVPSHRFLVSVGRNRRPLR